ncbi:MAG: hypothetical protein HYZ28_12250 [Myxococcales bacterium]|nr:hypothetical protein [Myxococcales bacterium]
MRLIPLLLSAALGLSCTQKPTQPPPEEQSPPEELAPAPPEVSTAEPGPVPELEMVEPLKPPPLSATTCAELDPAGATSVSSVRSVKVCANVLGARTGQKLVVELLTPRGMPYERREAILTGTPFEAQRVDFELMVAGTMIDTARLWGQWEALFLVDETAVGTQAFDLAQ